MQGNLDWATGMFCLIVWSSFWSPFQRSSFGHFCQRSSFWWLFPNLFFFWFPSQAGEVTAVQRMASSPYHVSSYIFSHISHILPKKFPNEISPPKQKFTHMPFRMARYCLHAAAQDFCTFSRHFLHQLATLWSTPQQAACVQQNCWDNSILRDFN